MTAKSEEQDELLRQVQSLRDENQELRAQLDESREILGAIGRGEVDALVVPGQDGERIFTLHGAEQSYRTMVEQMQEGAVTLSAEGTVLYANRRLAEMLQTPLPKLIGSQLEARIAPGDETQFEALLRQATDGSARGELRLAVADGSLVPVHLSLSRLPMQQVRAVCVVVTDLTGQRRSEEIVANERLARSILDHAAEAVVVCDSDGRIIRINEAARRLVAGNPLYQPFQESFRLEFLYTLGGEAVLLPQAVLFNARTIHGIEAVLTDSAGRRHNVLFSAGPLRVDRHHVIGCVITLVDVTQRKLAEEHARDAMDKNRQLLEQIATATPAILYIHDLIKGRNVYGNKGMLDQLGYAPEEMEAMGMRIFDLIHPEDHAHVIAKLSRFDALPEGEFIETEFRMRHANGSYRWLRARDVVFLRGADGKARQYLGVAQDITTHKQLEEQLRHARDEAEAASRSKDHFLAVLSHELRTPLTPVLTATQLMEMDPRTPAEMRNTISMIRRNIELEARLIDDLLDLTRVSRGKLELHFQPTDVHEKLRHVAEICDSDIRTKQLKLTIEPTAQRHHAQADPARLQQMLWNLLKNAVKFTPVGGSITVRTDNADDGKVRVTISDTGVGIEAEMLPRIFNAFEQGGRDITRLFGGLGLGLSITKGLVDLHGGSLHAHSQGKGRGSTFVLELPASTFADEAINRGGPIAAHAAEKNDCSVLLVEDHADTRQITRRLLEMLGYRVQTADCVATALRASQGDVFDIVICDIGLPDGSGLDLMRQLTAKRAVKGIALSGFGQDEDIRRSKEAGFVEHLTKPVDIHQLETVIYRLAH